jgi:hypothetical protein
MKRPFFYLWLKSLGQAPTIRYLPFSISRLVAWKALSSYHVYLWATNQHHVNDVLPSTLDHLQMHFSDSQETCRLCSPKLGLDDTSSQSPSFEWPTWDPAQGLGNSKILLPRCRIEQTWHSSGLAEPGSWLCKSQRFRIATWAFSWHRV